MGNSGIQTTLPDAPTATDINKLTTIEDIVNSWKKKGKNRCVRQVTNSENQDQLSAHIRFKEWTSVILSDMWEFSTCMPITIVSKPTLHDHWFTIYSVHSSFGSKALAPDRFLSILAFSHFGDNDNTMLTNIQDHDPLH
ncbi:hypothetical protein RRG08_061049 [Elysia crispata]|uniref:Uncharacterized protein n=1 Tax=Elysia crispata TaxID=231223 RepID=A0AAE1AWZ3_9GAST|nr:hypothetical protein RRG08_061049 [Elysia crispata]